MSAGTYHTCVIQTDGELSCWGNNGVGQLGTGHNSWGSGHGIDGPLPPAYGPSYRARPTKPCSLNADPLYACTDAYVCTTPMDLSFVAVRAADTTTCGVTSDGDTICWGQSYYGEGGDGVEESRRDANTYGCTPRMVCAPGSGHCENTTPFQGSSTRTCDVITVSEVN
jgi:hypothetical protein